MKVLLKLDISPLNRETVEIAKKDFPEKSDEELGIIFNEQDQQYYERTAFLESPYDIVEMTPEEYEYYRKLEKYSNDTSSKKDD